TTEITENTEGNKEEVSPFSSSSSVTSESSVVNIPLDELTNRIIGCAIEVHRLIGPGLLESAYEAALCWELEQAAIPYARQVPLPLDYKGHLIDVAYRMDIVVDDRVLLELKSIDKLATIHEAQMLTYLKLSGMKVGLLMNFNALTLVQGLRRFVA
ncbi:MAG: GxxExxY protein, partial [Rectinemataceae bacterium]